MRRLNKDCKYVVFLSFMALILPTSDGHHSIHTKHETRTRVTPDANARATAMILSIYRISDIFTQNIDVFLTLMNKKQQHRISLVCMSGLRPKSGYKMGKTNHKSREACDTLPSLSCPKNFSWSCERNFAVEFFP